MIDTNQLKSQKAVKRKIALRISIYVVLINFFIDFAEFEFHAIAHNWGDDNFLINILTMILFVELPLLAASFCVFYLADNFKRQGSDLFNYIFFPFILFLIVTIIVWGGIPYIFKIRYKINQPITFLFYLNKCFTGAFRYAAVFTVFYLYFTRKHEQKV